MVDDEDFEEMSKYNWSCGGRYSGKVYARRVTKSKGVQKSIYMHRVLMRPEPGMLIDHIDGNTLNNQKSNLRVCNHRENIRNGKNRTTNRSGFKGVSFIAAKKRYAAHIKHNYKSIYLGYFHNPKEAAVTYNMAAIYLFGEFAKLNTV